MRYSGEVEVAMVCVWFLTVASVQVSIIQAVCVFRLVSLWRVL